MKRLLLIGWDSADWKLIHPLLDKSYLPGVANLVEGGVSGQEVPVSIGLYKFRWGDRVDIYFGDLLTVEALVGLLLFPGQRFPVSWGVLLGLLTGACGLFSKSEVCHATSQPINALAIALRGLQGCLVGELPPAPGVALPG